SRPWRQAARLSLTSHRGARSFRLLPSVQLVMEILERIWEIVTGIGNALLGRFERGITGLFGSANARFLKRLQPRVEAIAALEPKYQAMTDEELRNQTAEFRRRLAAGETLEDLLVEAFAVCREG